MNDTTKIKKGWTFYAVLGVIGDIIMYPVIFLSLLCSIVMFTAKMDNKVPSFFGVSLAYISSGSMTKTGYLKGQSVFICATDTDKLREGDIISFYYKQDSYDSRITKTRIQDFDNLPFEDTDHIDYAERVGTRELQTDGTKIYFHEIKEIYIGSDGVRFFRTKGSSNNYYDGILTREDFVVGKYINTPLWLRNVFQFCNSSKGMITFIVAPLCILILLQSLSIIEQINNMVLEKKVIEGKESWKSKEARKANIGFEMDVSAKAYFYLRTPPRDRKEVWDFLFGNLKQKKGKINEQLVTAKIAPTKLAISEKEYWDWWQQNLKGKKNLNKLEYYKQKYYNERVSRH